MYVCIYIYVFAICLVVIICMVYKQEAKIYLEEGRRGDRLDFHPETVISYASYLVIHNSVYSISQSLVGILLMLLAFLERPSFIDVPNCVSMNINYM